MSKAKYPKYKPSKTLWQEQIPSHWQETELRMLFADNKNKNIGLVERNLLSLSYGKLKRKDIDTATGLVPASFEGYQIIDEGYIVLRFTDLQNDKKSLRVGYANEKGIITNAYIGLAPKTDIHSKYFYYQLHFLDKIKYFYNLGGGVRQSLAYKEFGRETVLVPDKDEQTAIANFLDFKLAKIDRFIRKKKELIKLLNEKKARIINQRIINGLDETVKQKSSNIAWLPSYPLHWKEIKLKSICNAFGRIGFRGYSTTDLVNKGEGAITISPSNIKESFMIFEKCSYLSWEKYEESPEIKIYNDDILIVKTGSTYGKIGIVKGLEHKATINPQLLVLKNISINPNYLYLLLKSIFVQSQVNVEVIGSTIPTISQTKILNFILVLPPKKEMELILKSIEVETKYINQLIATIEKELSLTEEYKTVLIAEAVTGKIDVRNFEIVESLEEERYEELEEELSIAAEDEVNYEIEN
jgi:type I restriction enzyme S subunit